MWHWDKEHENYSNNRRENKRKILEVWNWDGVPIAHYLLDKDIVNITVSSNKIYAVDNKNERVIYTYSLADIINKDKSWLCGKRIS